MEERFGDSALGCQTAKRLMNLNTRAEALQKLRAFLEEAWSLMGPSFIEATAEKEAAARVPKLATNEEDKLVAGKGKVSNFTMTTCCVLMILYS